MVSPSARRTWFSCAMSDYGTPYGGTPDQPGQSDQPGQYGQPGQSGQYGEPSPYGQYGDSGPRSDKRPGTVTAASIITIVMSALTLVLFGILAVVGAVARNNDDLLADLQKELDGQPGFEDVSAEDVANLLLGIGPIIALWSLAALVLAIFAMKRHNWARILVVVSAAISAIVSLIGITGGISIISLIASVAAIVLYFTGGAGDWYRRKNQPAGDLPPGTQYGG